METHLLRIYSQQLFPGSRGSKVLKKNHREVNRHPRFPQVLSETGFPFNSLILQEVVLVQNIDFTSQAVASV